MEGLLPGFYCGDSQRNSETACALGTNKLSNWSEFQTG